MAAIRGDASDADLFTRAAALTRSRAIESDADLEPLIAAPDTGHDPEIGRRLRHMYEAGAWVLVESAIADLPADLRWLFESGAVSLDELAALHAALSVTSAADLAAAVDYQEVRRVPGLDARSEYAIAGALFNLRTAVPRVPLGRALAIAEPLLDHLRSQPEVEWAETAGSLRRGQETVGDLEIVAATGRPEVIVDQLVGWPDAARVLHRSATRVYLLLERVQIGIRLPRPDVAGATLVSMTGSPAHISSLRALGRARGWRLDAKGLRNGDALVAGPDEGSVYAALGLPLVPAEIRNGTDELLSAQAGQLPRLIQASDIRGDLHMHSSWSDGRDSIETMAKACRDLGYQYMAITDHSPSSIASRTLSVAGVKAQADEIAQLRQRFPDIAILHGCEVDILGDGTLDFADSILEGFDIVLASLHDAGNDSPAQLLRRYTAAMRHPLVNMITHPTNRMVPARAGYDLDYDRLFELAVETGTILEIDGAPGHLDLDGMLARRAAAAGVTLAIDSDCHRAPMLGRQMRMGLMTARRGWIEARHVINTQPLSVIAARIAAKRGK